VAVEAVGGRGVWSGAAGGVGRVRGVGPAAEFAAVLGRRVAAGRPG